MDRRLPCRQEDSRRADGKGNGGSLVDALATADNRSTIEHVFDISRSVDGAVPLTAAALAGLIGALEHLDTEVDDAERIEQIRRLEELKSAAAAAQARVTAAFAASQRERLRHQGVPRAKQARPIGAQIALARRDSPAKGSRHLGVAEALVAEMPGTYGALARGEISEWRATIVVRETACLTRADRTAVDAELAPRLARLGDQETSNQARTIAYRLDPWSVMRRVRGAEADRRVTIRPAPDTMSLVTGFLPARHGVAVYAALTRHADGRRAGGDPRSRQQIMADEYVERLTRCMPPDRDTAEARTTGTTPEHIDVQLVMSDATLFGSDDAPATLLGYGPIPAPVARAMVADAGEDTRVWVRRLYTDAATGTLVSMDSRRRLFDRSHRRFLVTRDQVCRTPWCGAPIRHIDHVVPAASGGATSVANAQGLCEACNYVKQSPGWYARPAPAGQVETSTPTGHTYSSQAPPLTTPVTSAPTTRPGPVAGAGLLTASGAAQDLQPLDGYESAWEHQFREIVARV